MHPFDSSFSTPKSMTAQGYPSWRPISPVLPMSDFDDDVSIPSRSPSPTFPRASATGNFAAREKPHVASSARAVRFGQPVVLEMALTCACTGCGPLSGGSILCGRSVVANPAMGKEILCQGCRFMKINNLTDTKVPPTMETPHPSIADLFVKDNSIKTCPVKDCCYIANKYRCVHHEVSAAAFFDAEKKGGDKVTATKCADEALKASFHKSLPDPKPAFLGGRSDRAAASSEGSARVPWERRVSPERSERIRREIQPSDSNSVASSAESERIRQLEAELALLKCRREVESQKDAEIARLREEIHTRDLQLAHVNAFQQGMMQGLYQRSADLQSGIDGFHDGRGGYASHVSHMDGRQFSGRVEAGNRGDEFGERGSRRAFGNAGLGGIQGSANKGNGYKHCGEPSGCVGHGGKCRKEVTRFVGGKRLPHCEDCYNHFYGSKPAHQAPRGDDQSN